MNVRVLALALAIGAPWVAHAANVPVSYTVEDKPCYRVVFPAIPEIITYGVILDEARTMAAAALRCHLEGLAKDGEAFPVEPGSLAAPVKEELAIAL